MKTIESDPRIPGNRDEFLQAEQCSPELDSPSFQAMRPLSQDLQCLKEKLIVTQLKWLLYAKTMSHDVSTLQLYRSTCHDQVTWSPSQVRINFSISLFLFDDIVRL